MLNITKLKNIISKKGATINKKGNSATYLRNGFMCSVKDCFVLDIADIENILTQLNKILNTLKNGEYLGFWVENNKIYIDISKKFFSREFALIYGKIYQQKSIFDLNKKQVIYI